MFKENWTGLSVNRVPRYKKTIICLEKATDLHAEANVQYIDLNIINVKNVINTEVKQHGKICQKGNNCER
jgi:hypothetical protein